MESSITHCGMMSCNDVPSGQAPTTQDFAAAFCYCHDLLRKPSADQHAWLISEECGAIWRRLTSSLGHPSSPLEIADDFHDYESQYIATFDVGQPSPPVPLIESHYNKVAPVPQILHENLLFYKRFGLNLRADFGDTSDHLLCQLSFVTHLFGLLQQRDDANDETGGAQIIQAICDYSDRHLRSWIPAAIRAAEDVPFPESQKILTLVSCLVFECSALRR